MQIISTNTFLRCTNERWWRKTWQVGYFFAQKGSNCSTQSRKRSQTRAVESPEWFDCVEKRKIRAIRPRSCSFFSHRHVDDAVSRERRHPSSSNRDLWDDRSSEKGAIFVTTTRYRLLRATSTRYTFRFVVVLLFRRFMQSRRWFEIEDGFEIAVTKWRVCISDNEIVCTLFRIECGKRRVLILHLVLLAQSWSWSISFEICLEFSPIPVKIAKID